VVHGAHLVVSKPSENGVGIHSAQWHLSHKRGQLAILVSFFIGAVQLYAIDSQRYLGLIIIWATPFVMLLWTIGSQLILSLPHSAIAIPVILPTIYLWIVDTLAMRRGTWSISSGTKTGIFLWPHLEIEEALFFLLTNILVVFGQVAIDMTLAVLDNSEYAADQHDWPTIWEVIKALATPIDHYDETRIIGLRDSICRLKMKSRSFYLASAAFHGPLRYDLILLYSFCRAADDLVDEAKCNAEGELWVSRLNTFLDIAYDPAISTAKLRSWIRTNIPLASRSAFVSLPVSRLDKAPLLGLIKGFEMDLKFSLPLPKGHNALHSFTGNRLWPIATEQDLELYGSLVAGTVAHLVMNLVCYHCTLDARYTENFQETLITHASNMGTALQLVNIVRDVRVDASLSRVYLPTTTLKSHHLNPSSVLGTPDLEAIRSIRMWIIQRAFEIYDEAKEALDDIPPEARSGMRVAVESYMEIGRTMWAQGCKDDGSQRKGRATVPVGRRLWIAWKNLR
jgi:15-cis-phytoene synthase/lycopene beta-cyclase